MDDRRGRRSRVDIDLTQPTDLRVECPEKGCKVSMTLTPQGVAMMEARQTQCREHGVPLVVVDD